jgi:hypothetical protein
MPTDSSLNGRVVSTKKHSPKVEQYLLKRLSLLKQMFPLQE